MGLDDYLKLRRSLGYKLERPGEVLANFVAFAEAAGAEHVKTELALCWALQTANPDSRWRADRLGAVRSFARYLHAIDPSHEVPPSGLIPRRASRPAPYLYSKEQISTLMVAARQLRTPLQAATLETVVGLLAVSGLRVGEVIRLDDTDIDFEAATLHVRNTKGGRSRVVPLDSSALEPLGSYIAVREQWFPQPSSDSFFVSTVGHRLSSGNLAFAFSNVVTLAGLQARRARVGPNLGGFRHTFAVQTLLDWHRSGIDVATRLPWLSSFLGHVNPSSTYWYLSASPELMAAAAGRLELAFGGRS